MKSFGFESTAVVVINYSHRFELLSHQDLVFEQNPYEVVDQTNKHLIRLFINFKINDCELLALLVLVEPSKVLDLRWCDKEIVQAGLNLRSCLFEDFF